MASSVELIVGLRNPGEPYQGTRHNAGAWYVQFLLNFYGGSFKPEKKFHGAVARVNIAERSVWLLLPSTFMNLSGQSVAALANFYKIAPESILVAHDEIDIPVGVAKLKQGGGHGGHNGLRDIINHLGNNRSFQRLRLGIGHPGNSSEVHNYVLCKPSKAERQKIDEVIDQSVHVTALCVAGHLQKAMQTLHSFSC